MAESILQIYLNAQHIKITDQSNIDNLNKAVQEIKKLLEKKKALLIPYTLVALDPLIEERNQVVKDVEDVIIKKWPTFKNSVIATKDKSTTYVRSVILESLRQLTDQNDFIATIVWYTAQDVILHYQTGNEGEVIASLLQTLADKVESNARSIWGIINNVDIISIQVTDFNISISKAPNVDETNLVDHMKAALVHSGWKASAGGGENPSYQGNNDTAWPKFAAERSGKGIAKEVNAALANHNKFLSDIAGKIQQSLETYFSQLQPYFEKVSTSYANSIEANNKRSQLLWWKQTLYSSILRKSYRNFSLLEAALIMAIDLADQIESVYPVSVDFLLRETLRDVFGENTDKVRPLSEWIEEAASNIDEPVKNLVKTHVSESEGRKPFITELANVILFGNIKNFFSETGINNKAAISASDLSVWLLHGMQAKKIAELKLY